MKRFAVALALVALVALAVLGLTPGTASATNTAASISIQNSAQLVTPREVNVSVIYSCAPASPSNTGGFLGVNVDQGNAFGGGSVRATCDDKTHNTTVSVSSFGAFTQGQANASGELVNGDGFVIATQEAEITIK
jgi:hypothetical protein